MTHSGQWAQRTTMPKRSATVPPAIAGGLKRQRAHGLLHARLGILLKPKVFSPFTPKSQKQLQSPDAIRKSQLRKPPLCPRCHKPQRPHDLETRHKPQQHKRRCHQNPRTFVSTRPLRLTLPRRTPPHHSSQTQPRPRATRPPPPRSWRGPTNKDINLECPRMEIRKSTPCYEAPLHQ